MQYGKFAAVYDRLMEHMPYGQWGSWIERLWERFGKPDKVVDLGCGTGTLTWMIAQHGVQVYGVDISAEMLTVAREKERHALCPSPITWLEQDMTELALSEPVDAAYSFCDSLNYLLDEEQVTKTFSSVYDQLTANGVFSFDMLSDFQYEEYAAEQPYVLDEEELAYIWQIEYDRHKRIIEHDLTFFAQLGDGNFERFYEHHEQRAYSPQWVIQTLQACGFKKVWCGADFHWHCPNEQPSRYFFTALKQS